MNLAEFKAWFEGFTEDMDGPPSAKQWKRIKARVKEIDGVALTMPIYVERYIRPLDWQIRHGSIGISNQSDLQNVTANMLLDSGRAEYKATA